MGPNIYQEPLFWYLDPLAMEAQRSRKQGPKERSYKKNKTLKEPL